MPWPTCEEGFNLRKLTLFASQVVNDFKTIPPPSGGGILEAIARFKGPWWFCSHWLPEGMLGSEVGGTGSIAWRDSQIHLETGSDPDSYALAYKTVPPVGTSWEKRRYLGLLAYFSFLGNQVVHLISGDFEDPLSPNNSRPHIGFKAVGANLYGTVGDGSSEAVLLLDTLPQGVGSGWKRLECLLIPGQECRFYLDGVDKGALTTSLPTGTNMAESLLLATVSNPQTGVAGVDVAEVRAFQEE